MPFDINEEALRLVERASATRDVWEASYHEAIALANHYEKKYKGMMLLNHELQKKVAAQARNA